MKEPGASDIEKSPSQLISERIAELGDWRGAVLANVRRIIHDADPDVIEELKWKKPTNPLGTPTWSHDGIICTGETYGDHVKFTFAKGGSIKDPKGVFTQMGRQRRAIDVYEGDKINEPALREIVRAAVRLNSSVKKKR